MLSPFNLKGKGSNRKLTQKIFMVAKLSFNNICNLKYSFHGWKRWTPILNNIFFMNYQIIQIEFVCQQTNIIDSKRFMS